MPQFLVEIRLKDWVSTPSALGGRVVTYEEVEASDEYYARHAGFAQFSKRAKYEPILRRKMERWELATDNCCAPDAVQLD